MGGVSIGNALRRARTYPRYSTAPQEVPVSRPRAAISVVVVMLALGLSGCASTQSPADDLVELAGWMEGTFDSAEQSAAAPDDYFPIRLVMVPIWEERTDGHWLYVEQAVIGKEDRPYRQRVYRVSMNRADDFRSDVFELPDDPAAFVGAWEDLDLFKTFEPEDLEPRSGCTIFLRRRSDGAFAGETRGTRCTSRLGDAAYATSQVVITPKLLTSWDRGFTSDNEHAWGAEKGPYLFRKTSSGWPAGGTSSRGE